MSNYILPTYTRNEMRFKKGEGIWLYSECGKKVLDMASGIGVNSVGHAHPKLLEAICEQAKEIIHISNLQPIAPQEELAKQIVELSGFDMALFFANSGAEANEAAIKLARKVAYGRSPKRKKIITLGGSFHGRTMATLSATAQEHFHPQTFAPYVEGFVHASTLEELRGQIDDSTAAIMIELVQGEGGVEALDKEEVKALVSYAQANDVLVIVDEVQTGIYRTGSFLASNLYEIEPDVITLAKGLGGGVPIGAMMTSHKKGFEPGDHGSTFGGNYLSTRAALAVLELLGQPEMLNNLQESIKRLEGHLEQTVQRYGELFKKAVGAGMMRGLRAKDTKIQAEVIQAALDEELLVLKAGRATVRFLPPLIMEPAQVDEAFARLWKALDGLNR